MHAVQQIAIRVAAVDDLDNVREAYRAWGYRGSIGPNDKVFVAEGDGELLGIVRLAQEDEIYVLRGMQVSPSSQRQGIGTALLLELMKHLGGAECYCVPYTHLDEFYAQVGFRECSSKSAPRFLVDRLSQYLKNGREVILMRRPEPVGKRGNAG
jgi:N-acetylglutamate synthase-like GNAT family acetyltransferase